ncbi:hypothetical protein MKW94_024237 [Papaver nudicaule]|uniref:BAHD acyltransferase n=1 Tax=Papaver nudicaule TaxID=74823 RepID=A0AA41W1K8_PAPNU|nr:hypothetical protein [Papaver nudicaule]
MEVEIISKETIKPSIPTPHHLKTFNLSSLDQYRPSEYIPLILFYTPNPTQIDKDHLKKSLSATLNRFYPLAGRIRDKNTWVECTDEGVDYIETRVHGKLSDYTMTSNLLHKLVPVHTNLPTEVPAIVQVNFFDCVGIAITVCISHKIGDTSTYATFITGWAATARGAAADDIVYPSFDSQTMFPVDTASDFTGYGSSDEEENENLVTKRLVFSDASITALRQRIADTQTTLKYPTRVEAVSALIWKSAMEASSSKPLPQSNDQTPVSWLRIIVNLRKKMNPPLGDSSFGNIFTGATAKSPITCGGVELVELLGRVRSAIQKVDCEYVKKMQDDEDFDSDFEDDHEEDNDYWLMSWCNFPLYESDFGFGKPYWVTTDAVEVLDENDIYLLDARVGKGVEAWIKLKEEKMAMFLNNLDILEFASIFD